jgi:hypothetical protein
MASKTSHESQDQGALFAEHISGGATDPALYDPKVELEPIPEGVYQEKSTPTPELLADKELIESVHKAVVTQHRRTGQTGKHSPLQREGTYTALKPGDYLPGFGPVTDTNFSAAKKRAEQLEQQRR